MTTPVSAIGLDIPASGGSPPTASDDIIPLSALAEHNNAYNVYLSSAQGILIDNMTNADILAQIVPSGAGNNLRHVIPPWTSDAINVGNYLDSVILSNLTNAVNLPAGYNSSWKPGGNKFLPFSHGAISISALSVPFLVNRQSSVKREPRWIFTGGFGGTTSPIFYIPEGNPLYLMRSIIGVDFFNTSYTDNVYAQFWSGTSEAEPNASGGMFYEGFEIGPRGSISTDCMIDPNIVFFATGDPTKGIGVQFTVRGF